MSVCERAGARLGAAVKVRTYPLRRIRQDDDCETLAVQRRFVALDNRWYPRIKLYPHLALKRPRLLDVPRRRDIRIDCACQQNIG